MHTDNFKLQLCAVLVEVLNLEKKVGKLKSYVFNT